MKINGGYLQVKPWLASVVILITIVTATVAIGQALTIGPLKTRTDALEVKVETINLEFSKAIAEMRRDQEYILKMLEKMDLKLEKMR